MKKILYIFVILLTFTHINNLFSQTWQTIWNSNGSPWIGGWHIGNEDKYVKIKVGGLDGFLVTNFYNHYAATMFYNPSWQSWSIWWNNSGNSKIGNMWTLSNVDEFYPIDLSGLQNSNYLFCLNRSNNKVVLLFYAGGPYDDAWSMYMDFGTGGFPNWNRNIDDRYIVGNFNGTTASQELLLISNLSRWATLEQVGNPNWTALWSNGGNGSLPGWIIRSDDQFFSANLDGGSEDELVCMNRGTGWCSIFKFQNSTWNAIWSNGGSGVGLGGWTINNNSYNKYITGNFNGDNREDLLLVNNLNRWSTIKNYQNTTYFPDFFSNYGNGSLGSWYIGEGSEMQTENYMTFFNNYIFSVSPVGGRAMLQTFDYLKNLTLTMNFESCPVQDTVTVELRSNSSPYNIIESKKALAGQGIPSVIGFNTASNGTPYYIAVRHRNAITTWSSNAVSFSGNTLNYNFTSSNSQSYGNNMKNSGGLWSFYQGDVNQDEIIDATDLNSISSDADITKIGPYLVTDLNFDQIVDSYDISIVENNSGVLIQVIRP